MRDLHSNIKVVSLIDPIVGNNDTEGGSSAAGLDTLGFGSAELIAQIGTSGDTLSGSVKIDIILEDSTDDSTYTAVTDSNLVLFGSNSNTSAPDSSGIIATVDGTADDNLHYRVGYLGTSRYVRLRLDFTGTHTNGTPIAVMGVLSNASRAATSD